MPRFQWIALALAALLAAPASANDNEACSHGNNDRDARIAACTRLIGSKTLTGTRLARVYAVRGFTYYLVSQYDRAAVDLGEAIRLNPKSEEYRIDRGNIYVRQDKYDLAIADYTEAIRLTPNKPDGYMARASAYDRRGNYDRAIADYTEAIRIAPSNYSPYFYRGSIYYYNKRDDPRAIADLTRAVQLNPESSVALVVRARAFERMGDLDKALADAREAVRVDPKYGSAIEALERITKALAARGSPPPAASAPSPPPAPPAASAPTPPVASAAEADRAGCQRTDVPPADAIAACTRLIASKVMAGSELAVVHLWRGMHRIVQSDPKGAMQDYNAALKLDPKMPSGYLFRAALLEAQKDVKRALADYRQAASLDPALQDATDGIRRLEVMLKGATR